MMVCENCKKMLKKCEVCGKFSFPDEKNCHNPNCRKIRENGSFGLKKSLKTEETNTKDLNCCNCNAKFNKFNGKECYKCLDESEDCIYCENSENSTLAICENCIKKLKICKTCKESLLPNKKCEKSSCELSPKKPSILLQNQSLKPVQLLKEKEERPSACIVCDKKLSQSYGFCLDCKLKCSALNCKFCECPINKTLCEQCIRSTVLCGNCNHRYHIQYDSCRICVSK